MPNAKSRFETIRRTGGTPVGAFASSVDPATTTIFGAAGYDYVIIDGEHGPIDRLAAAHHVRAAHATGTVPIVRVLANDASLIQSYLDIGAEGIVVPKVQSADDARRAVAATQYRAGGRGACPGVEASRYTAVGWREHADGSNDNVLTLPLIETRAGVERADEIAAVEGVDGLVFGPADMAQDMGITFTWDDPRITQAWNTVRDATRAAGIWAFAPNGFGLEGADVVFGGMDLMMLRAAADRELAAIRAATAT